MNAHSLNWKKLPIILLHQPARSMSYSSLSNIWSKVVNELLSNFINQSTQYCKQNLRKNYANLSNFHNGSTRWLTNFSLFFCIHRYPNQNSMQHWIHKVLSRAKVTMRLICIKNKPTMTLLISSKLKTHLPIIRLYVYPVGSWDVGKQVKNSFARRRNSLQGMRWSSLRQTLWCSVMRWLQRILQTKYSTVSPSNLSFPPKLT